MSLDFEKEVANITSLVPDGYELEEETTSIAIEVLQAVDERYGPDGDNVKSFHNAPHSVGVGRRNVRMGLILLPYMHSEYQEYFFEALILGGLGHDYDQDSGPGANEKNSGIYTVGRVEAADGQLNTPAFKRRITYGIGATEVEMRDSGELVQVNLQSGVADPIKFAMAFSDINGIAMEGSARMLRDATNLYYEITETPSVEGWYAFLLGQANFLKQRLNDHRIKSDIAYFFPDKIDPVYDAMYQNFHHNITSAYELALHLKESKKVESLMSVMAKSIDKSQIGGVATKILIRKLAADQ